MLQEVASISNYTVYHDTTRGNYKIHNGLTIISNPSTIEDAYNKLHLLTNSSAVLKCEGCNIPNCNECERFS